MLVFVNGYTLGCKPFRPYWSSSSENPDEFIQAAINFFDDDHIENASFINGSGAWFGSVAQSRQLAGNAEGKKNHKAISRLLATGETIKIISHSMGAAFAEGLADSWTNEALPVEKIIHFAPSDARNIQLSPTTKAIDRLQLNATGDLVIERFANPFSRNQDLIIPGINRYGKVKWDPWIYHEKHMRYITDKRKAMQLDSHFDTKTYAFVFDWATDLKNLKLEEKIGTRKYKNSEKDVMLIRYKHLNHARFEQLYIGQHFYKFLEPYEKGKSDKFLQIF